MAEANKSDSLWTPANKVTFLRIILIPVFVLVLIAPWPLFFPDWMYMPTVKPWLAAAVFIALSLTDTLDGYLARSRGEVTDFGKFMDPLADKLLVTAALLGLIELGVVPSWVALVIIAREFIVSGLRMVAASKGEVIAASIYGKVKTVFQMLAIVLFIVKDSHVISDISPLGFDILYVASWAIMVAALVLTILSMLDYVYKSRHLLGFRGRKAQDAAVPDVYHVRSSFVDGLHAEGLAAHVLDTARRLGFSIATAESCTGGLVSAALTSVPGSSDVVSGGVVSYSNDVKRALLGVSAHTLETVGAVSEQTACQMAQGALEQTGADVAVSVTGIAGPGGGSPEKPVGTVWIGLADASGSSAQVHHFAGGRDDVRSQTVETALRVLCERMESASGHVNRPSRSSSGSSGDSE